METEIARVRPPCDRFAPRLVRQALGQLRELGWVAGDAMLVATELVTNAVRHSDGTPDDRLDVRVHRDRERLRISVRDPGISGGTARIANPPDPWGGLGLRLVSQLACSWGSRRHSDGYEVWAELRVPMPAGCAG